MAAEKIPSPEYISLYLKEANDINPGPWYDHSLNVGKAAGIVGEAAGLDPDKAFALGTLHDIGRRAGVTGMRHTIDGYHFMKDEGYPQIARICLTHSFPLPDAHKTYGKNDCTSEEFLFIQNFLDTHPFDDYDRLIQLCDCLADAKGFCAIEKRIVDVIIRYGTFAFTRDKTAAYLDIKNYFDGKIGHSLYTLLPGISENTLV